MRRSRSKLTRITCGMIFALAVLAPAASASRGLSISPEGAFRTTSQGALTFQEPLGLAVICNVTLSGTIVASISKTRGTQIGSITEGRTANCVDSSGGAARMIILCEMRTPCLMYYQAFLGTLPNISGILIRKELRGLITMQGSSCLYETVAGSPELGLLFSITSGTVGRGTWLEGNVRLKITLAGICPSSVMIRGSSNVSPTLTIRLVN